MGWIHNPETEQNYWEDPEYAHWVDEFTERQGQYMYEDNDEWGPFLETWRLFQPETYVVPEWKQWGNLGGGTYGWVTTSVPSDVYPCIIDYNNSRDIIASSKVTGEQVLYDCDRLKLVVVECLSGWSEGALNSEVKRTCREKNQEFFDGVEDDKVYHAWERTMTAAKKARKERIMSAAEDVQGVYLLNSILIALETGSFAMTLAGILLSVLSGLCAAPQDRHVTSTSDAAETVQTDSEAMEEAVQTDSEVPGETAPLTALLGADHLPESSPSTASDSEKEGPHDAPAEHDSSSVFQSSDGSK